ncbi:MAG: hypothetical protein AAGH89_01095 [Verrucomicrobiota bacterium]
MSGDSYVSESARTGSFAMISLGDGSINGSPNDGDDAFAGDRDGLYDLNDLGSPNPFQFGGGLDIFPTETAFSIGALTYDESQVLPVGASNFAISSIALDLSSDINMTNWFAFTPTGAYSFGALDAADTITFQDGILSGVDLEVDLFFALDTTNIASLTDATVTSTTWQGTFSISGSDISLQINENQLVADPFGGVPIGGFPPGADVSSTFTLNATGTVNAIPEPSGLVLVALVTIPGFLIRRQRG